MSTDIAANMRAATEMLVMAFDGKWKTDEAIAPRAENCMHEILPASLGIPKKNNTDWATRLDGIKHLILEAKMVIDDYVSAPEDRRAVCRSTMDSTTKVGPYHNEYIWILTFDDRGEKITSITEFLDTQAVADLRARLKEAGIGGV